MTYSLLDLEVFTTAQRFGSLGRAATALHLTQPSVSSRLRNLERAVGMPLFNRSRKGVALTMAGERFLPIAEKILELAAQGPQVAADVEDVRTFTLGVHGTLAPSVVPRFARALAKQPVELRVRDAHSGDLVRMVAAHDLTGAVVVPVPAPAHVELMHLLDDVIVCATAPSHPLAGATIALTDLSRQQLAVNTWGEAAGAFVHLLTDAAIPRRNVCWVATAATATALATDLGHIAVVPRSTVQGAFARGDLVPITVTALPRWSLPLLFAYRRGENEVRAVADAAFNLGRRRRRGLAGSA